MNNKKRILVVEDNETNMYLISFILKSRGYEIIEAKSGEEGERKTRPDFNGYSAAGN